VIIYEVTKLDPMSYLKKGGKYRGYYGLPDGKRCKATMWFEVDEVLKTAHHDPDVCFEGTVRIRKISKPKQIALKDKYPDYSTYLTDWHGVEDEDRQGYDFNPKAKWDWYQLGGRWTGFFRLKPQTKGELGRPSLVSSHRADPGTVDQARKKDIDFEKMRLDNFEFASDTYDKFEKATQDGTLNSPYFEYGIRNIGKDVDNFIPETREQFIKRHASITTFAVLKDGEWYERGEMGWWGTVSNEKNSDEWEAQFEKLINDLPDDTLLSLYDCHI